VEFGLSEEQNLLARSVNGFLDNESSLDKVRGFAADGGDVWKGLCELGVAALLIDESAGGLGLSMLDAAIVAEALGSHTAPAPFISTAVMLPLALKLAGGDHDALLAGLASGATTAAAALAQATGARNGSGVTSTNTSLSGNTLYSLDFDTDVYLVADSNRRLFLVESDAAGLRRQNLATIDRTRSSGELKFDNTPAKLLSEDPAVLQGVLNAGRVMLAADTLGAAQNMLDQAVEYARQREQFNRPIASFQAVKHMCAEMAAGLEPCRAMVWYAAHVLDTQPEEATMTAAHTKAHVSEVGKFIAKTATEVHGGMGFTDLVGLHYWFKRIGFNRQLLGGPEGLREEAARAQNLVS